MNPFFTNDAIIFGILAMVLAFVFYTSSSENKRWKTFYKFVPALLLCYFIPALLHWPFNFISAHWISDSAGLIDFLNTHHSLNISAETGLNQLQEIIKANKIESSEISSFYGHSNIYFVTSRYLLPASLILLCLSIDIKGILNLGPKALIMFFTATVGIMIGGPIALAVIIKFFPNLLAANNDELWRGLSTVAGSWIGGGANQTAMKEVYEVKDNLFATMVVVDVIVANVWMGFLLYGASIRTKIDKWLKADNTAIDRLEKNISNYRGKIEKIPTTTDAMILLGVAFFGVALSHWGADFMSNTMSKHTDYLRAHSLDSLKSHFFWLIVFSTTFGIILSFTKAKKLEGVGASRWGTVFIYFLVASIGMKMNISEIFDNIGLFAIGFLWMLVHVILLIVVAKFIKAPFFFVAVGSQANVGGAASAPIVASAFSTSLAPVGVLLAVLGYAAGTYGALICAEMMRGIVGF